jgi:hypothetical protein
LSEKVPDSLNGPDSREEDLLDLGVCHEVQVTLAITGFDVGETMPLLRKGSKGLDQEPEGFYLDREFTCLGPEDLPFQSDKIANIEGLEELKGLISNGILLDVSLDSSHPILNVDETGFAKIPDGNNPSSETESSFSRLQLLIGLGAKGLL